MDVREKLIEILEEPCGGLYPACELADYLLDQGVTVQEQKSPCSLCGYGGKYLDAPPCTQCPAHPKEQPNANQRNSNASNVQEWISVKDRLPEEDGAYLVTTNSFGDCQSVKFRWFAKDGENVDTHDLAGQKDVWYLYDSECGYVSIKTVTHWMPLPQPAEGE